MKTLEEAGNSSPLRLYLSGATPPVFHFANRQSAAPTDALFPRCCSRRRAERRGRRERPSEV